MIPYAWIGLGLFAAGSAAGWTVNAWRFQASEAADMRAIITEQADAYRGQVDRLRVRETDLEALRREISLIEVKAYEVSTPDCSDLGSEWLHQYIAAIAAANRDRSVTAD